MTLENCKRLFKHFNDLADGTIEKPVGHKDWGDVVANAKVRAKLMEERVKRKTERYTREGRYMEPVEKPKAVKSHGKK